MKNSLLLATALLATAAVQAQVPDSTKPAQPVQPTQPAQPVQPEQPTQPTSAPVVTTTGTFSDTSVNAAYIADREALRGLKTENLRPEHAFPVLGTYTASGSSTGDLTVTLDPINKGIVWVEGLPQGRFKALMKKAPSTYKIPAQKTEGGKDIAEGTLFLNPTSKELSIVLGRAYNEAEPIAFLTTTDTKQKSKAWRYTGVKAATALAPVPQQ